MMDLRGGEKVKPSKFGTCCFLMLVLVYPDATYIRASSHASCPEYKP